MKRKNEPLAKVYKCVFGFLLAVLLSPAGYAGVIVSSTWDNPADGVDGWTFVHDGSNLVRVASGGNPGGFLQITDGSLGQTMFFSAPSKFLGNLSSAYGGVFDFDLQQSTSGGQYVDPDGEVLLFGGGTVLAISTSTNPAVTPNWTSYSVLLQASAGWKVTNISGAAATEAQMHTVLSNLTAIWIRAEFSSQVDVDGLDNAAIVGAPEPGSFWLALIAATGLCLWRYRAVACGRNLARYAKTNASRANLPYN